MSIVRKTLEMPEFNELDHEWVKLFTQETEMKSIKKSPCQGIEPWSPA